MKNTKKALLMTLCAVMLVAASVMGTMAYLTSTTNVVNNTFTVGNVAITLDEYDWDNSTANAERDIENKYHLMPGHEYKKDPTVVVEGGSENAYVRAFVTVTYDKAADAVLANHNYLTWLDLSRDWTVVDMVKSTTENEITRTYEFRYNNMVAASEQDTTLAALFTTIKVPGDLTNEELATLSGMQIDVIAHAIQADGFANADVAWGEWK